MKYKHQETRPGLLVLTTDCSYSDCIKRGSKVNLLHIHLSLDPVPGLIVNGEKWGGSGRGKQQSQQKSVRIKVNSRKNYFS